MVSAAYLTLAETALDLVKGTKFPGKESSGRPISTSDSLRLRSDLGVARKQRETAFWEHKAISCYWKSRKEMVMPKGNMIAVAVSIIGGPRMSLHRA